MTHSRSPGYLASVWQLARFYVFVVLVEVGGMFIVAAAIAVVVFMVLL